MKKCLQFYGVPAVLLVLQFSAAVPSVDAREDTRSLFQFSTPIDLPAVTTPQLAELQLTASVYNSVRDDFADFRIVQNSNSGVVPVIISKRILRPADAAALVEREFTILDAVAYDLKTRYADSHIITIQTGRMPITQFGLRADTAHGYQYMLLGRGGINATGAEWNLLVHSELSADSDGAVRGERVDFDFPESCYSIYAIVVDSIAPGGHFSVESVRGPEYCGYFQAQPGESYSLLNGYPDASPLVGFNTSELTRMLEKGVTPVSARANPLIENPEWRGRSFWVRAKDKMFILPVAVVALLILALLVFLMIYAFVNRQKPLKLQPRPRFQK